jgi:hypothetical protein
MKQENLSGLRYGRLTVLSYAGMINVDTKRAAWRCRCDCGAKVIVLAKSLRNGLTKSCGCLKSDKARARLLKHGACKSREYGAWCAIKTRCYNANTPTYKDYGGRGIYMADKWRHDFERFRRDMGPCPLGYQVERIDNNGPYAPGNCKWANRFEQQANTRATKLIELNGQRHTTSEWERRLGFTSGTIKRRLQRGWTVERALTEAVRR